MSRTYRNWVKKYYWYGVILSGHRLRDGKPYWKSPKWFKKMQEKVRRHRANQDVRSGKEPEIFKRENDWNWN